MELVDVRSKVSTTAHAVLLAEERATGHSVSEIVRDLIEPWAAQRVHAANVLAALLRSEGSVGDGEGRA